MKPVGEFRRRTKSSTKSISEDTFNIEGISFYKNENYTILTEKSFQVLLSISDRIEREFFSKKFFLDFFLKMTPMGVILMREIDCAHSRSVKTPS